MQNKSAGYIAFSAYNVARGGVNFRGDKTPEWPELPAPIRAAWEDAATAVVDALGDYYLTHWVCGSTSVSSSHCKHSWYQTHNDVQAPLERPRDCPVCSSDQVLSVKSPCQETHSADMQWLLVLDNELVRCPTEAGQ